VNITHFMVYTFHTQDLIQKAIDTLKDGFDLTDIEVKELKEIGVDTDTLRQTFADS